MTAVAMWDSRTKSNFSKCSVIWLYYVNNLVVQKRNHWKTGEIWIKSVDAPTPMSWFDKCCSYIRYWGNWVRGHVTSLHDFFNFLWIYDYFKEKSLNFLKIGIISVISWFLLTSYLGLSTTMWVKEKKKGHFLMESINRPHLCCGDSHQLGQWSAGRRGLDLHW